MTVRKTGFGPILIATAGAGIAGYLVTWLVYRFVGPADYALFAVFWASLYLLVGGLSGIQQEVTRATRSIPFGARERPSGARNFALGAAGLVAVAVVCTAPLWATQVFPGAGWALVWPLAIGAASYVFVAVLCGSLYGVSQWRSLALMIAADGVLRLALVGMALAVTRDIVVLAWMASVPFPLAIILMWPVVRRRFVGRSDIDVGYRALTWNVARTVLASVSTAVLVSGFPVLLGISSPEEDQATVGALIFVITLTRAPLIVTVMSLQSYLVIRFRDYPDRTKRTFAVVLGAVAGATAVLGLLGWLVGKPVLEWVSGGDLGVDGAFVALLVVSAAAVGALCVTGAALLAHSRHFAYSTGWFVAALATIAFMLLPLDLISRVSLALIAGPLAGLLFHGAAFAARGERQR